MPPVATQGMITKMQLETLLVVRVLVWDVVEATESVLASGLRLLLAYTAVMEAEPLVDISTIMMNHQVMKSTANLAPNPLIRLPATQGSTSKHANRWNAWKQTSRRLHGTILYYHRWTRNRRGATVQVLNELGAHTNRRQLRHTTPRQFTLIVARHLQHRPETPN